MKKYILATALAVISLSCSGQNKKEGKVQKIEKEKSKIEQPKGSWTVEKEFDDQGNLIRYDSIYSWTSSSDLSNLSAHDRDSLLQKFKSRFYTDFSEFESQGFDNIFSQDSLFSQRFFNDEFFESNFGRDFMDIDRIRQEMFEKQKKFLEKYQSEFKKPEEKK